MSENNRSQERRLVNVVSNLKISNILIFLLLFAAILLAIRIYIQVAVSQQDQAKPLVLIITFLTEWLSGAAFSTVLVSFAYEWLVRHETQRSLELFFQDQLQKQETILVNSVVVEIPKALLLNEDVQNRLLSGNNKLIENILRNFISLRLGDKIMGAGLYEGLLSKTLSYPERYIDYRNEIILASIKDADTPEIIRKRFYNVTLNVRYRTKLQASEFRFARAFDIDQYNLRIRDLKYRYVLLFPKNEAFPEKSALLYINSFRVDDEEFKPVEKEVDGVHEWIIEDPKLQQKLNTEVTVQYSILTKTYRYGHAFNTNIVKPTHNCLFIFNYGQSDIAHATAYDFFVSSKVPRIYKTPPDNPQMIFVELDEWAFPKGGVVFSWTLEEDRRIIEEAEKASKEIKVKQELE